MYLDGQQYFMAVLDISRKATAVKGRGESGLSQRRTIAAPLKTPQSFAPFQCRLRNNASDIRPIDALAACIKPPSHSPRHQPTVQPCDPEVLLVLYG